jgi:leucyl-tRNA synthetase
LYCEACGEMPVPEEQLPVLLPVMADFQPDGTGR